MILFDFSPFSFYRKKQNTFSAVSENAFWKKKADILEEILAITDFVFFIFFTSF